MHAPSHFLPATTAARMGRPPIPETLRNNILAHALKGDTKYAIAQRLGTNRTTVRRVIAAAIASLVPQEPVAA